MIAADIMTRAVVTIPSHAPISDAIRLMLGQRISGLPVTDGHGLLVGILTEGDLLRRAETGTEKARSQWQQFLRGAARQAEDYVRTHGRKVEELMTREVLTAEETAPLEHVVALMESKHVKRIPIVAAGQLVGVISRSDLLRALIRELDAIPPAIRSDSALREQIVAELRRQPWGGRTHVTVVVTGGVVYLEGIITDERERGAVRVAAENVPGVSGVRDHLQYCNPNVALSYGF